MKVVISWCHVSYVTYPQSVNHSEDGFPGSNNNVKERRWRNINKTGQGVGPQVPNCHEARSVIPCYPMGKLRRGFDDVESVVLFLGSSSSIQTPVVEEQQDDYTKDEIASLKETLAIERIGKRLRKKDFLTF